ncbi:hypothetical protein HK405_012507, partial [Cladochytrium tenue]
MAERACQLCLATEAFDVVAAVVYAISGTAYGGGDAEAAVAARAAAVDAVGDGGSGGEQKSMAVATKPSKTLMSNLGEEATGAR